eukprot:COSAG06_NODE_71615_length_181_cov_164.853659_1_plen_22_part_01
MRECFCVFCVHCMFYVHLDLTL